MKDDRIIKMAETHGTPLYLYDGDRIAQQAALLRHCLPEGWDIFYSLKCNPLLGVCELLRKEGCQIEAASLGELRIAVEAGFRPDQIIFTSPGKTAAELEAAVELGIYSINVESVEEARLISKIAGNRGVETGIAVRVNPNFNPSRAGMRMAGVPTQFGIDQDEIDEAVEEIMRLPHVRLLGVHVFTASQVLEAESLVANMQEIIKLALDLSARHGFELRFLDLGGGFGVPYFNGEEPLDLDLLTQGLAELWSTYGNRLAGTRVGVESGRFLLAEAGVFVTKVLYVKSSKGMKYLVCDGGSNHHASSAFLGRYVRNNFPMRLAGKDGDPYGETNVVGSLCTPTDVLGQRVMLPEAVPGDMLVVEKSGAYGLTHSPVLFLSHMLPAEVMLRGDQSFILRERGKVEDLLLRQQGLPKKGAFADKHVEVV